MSTASLRARYLGDTVTTASPQRLLVMLYDRLALDLERGHTALTAGDREAATEQLQHAQDVVFGLLESLQVDAWEGAPRLAALYNWLITELGAVNPGETAQYIPVLAEADPDRLGIALATPTGRLHSAGDADVEFTIQSASKPFTYAAALVDRGFAAVDRQVGLNPSGEAFNELSLEAESHRPDNAMINAGALAVHQLLVGPEASRKERLDRAVEIMSLLAGRRLAVDRGRRTSPRWRSRTATSPWGTCSAATGCCRTRPRRSWPGTWRSAPCSSPPRTSP